MEVHGPREHGWSISAIVRDAELYRGIGDPMCPSTSESRVVRAYAKKGHSVEHAQGTPFVLSDYIRVLRLEKYVDTWRQLHPKGRKYTWYTKRKNKESLTSEDYNGFRLDYIFVSPGLRDRVVSANHIDDVRVRMISDHAIVIADVAVPS